jgi:hypothetical protein
MSDEYEPPTKRFRVRPSLPSHMSETNVPVCDVQRETQHHLGGCRQEEGDDVGEGGVWQGGAECELTRGFLN